MLIWRGVDAVPPDLGATVVTIGNFDGVHRGHQHVINRAREVAASRDGIPVVAVTFDPHPMEVLAPDHAPPSLLSLDERLKRLEHAGVGAVLLLEFTHELASVEAADFARDVLFEHLHASAVVVGENFRFGHRARGDVALLREVAGRAGVDVYGLELDGTDGATWSSTYVRQQLDAGAVDAAADALRRPYSVSGEVVPGHQRGRDLLGYPTANVPVRGRVTAIPADGVYAGWLRRLDVKAEGYQPAAISVGTNPTFDGVERTVEAYVLDRDDLELYGVEVEIVFVRRLRGMVKFDDIDDLVKQMDADVDQARDLLSVEKPPSED
jgi:riboflavin kinase/FMN adenylyltransferase